MPLYTHQIEELAGALANIDFLVQEVTTGALYGKLPHKVTTSLTTTNNRVVDKLEEIVRLCDKFDQLDWLLDWVRNHGGEGTAPFDRVEELYADFLYSVLPLSVKNDAVALLESIPIPNVEVQRLATLSRKGPSLERFPESLRGVMGVLSRCPQGAVGEFTHPALEFLARVALEYGLKNLILYGKLRDLIERARKLTSRLPNINFDMIVQALKESAKNGGRTFFILFEVRPTGELGSDLGPFYQLDGWIFEEGKTGPLHFEISEESGGTSFSVAGLREPTFRLIDRLTQAVGYDDGRDTLLFEFYVPPPLRGEEFDRWSDVGSPPIGELYPTVVRCRDRHIARGPVSTHKQIKQAWGRFRDWWDGSPKPVETVWVETPDEADPEAVRQALKAAHAKGPSCTIVLVTESDLDATRYAALIQRILDLGVPLALWVRRRPGSADRVRDEIQTRLISPEPSLRNLPQRICDYRRGGGGLHYVGEALTLLWDDPSHLPPLVLKPLQLPPVDRVNSGPGANPSSSPMQRAS